MRKNAINQERQFFHPTYAERPLGMYPGGRSMRVMYDGGGSILDDILDGRGIQDTFIIALLVTGAIRDHLLGKRTAFR
jgi:hypothetical protein